MYAVVGRVHGHAIPSGYLLETSQCVIRDGVVFQHMAINDDDHLVAIETD
jgi:hypothetical protein